MIEKLKKKIVAQLTAFQESSTYIALEERYDRLQPSQQTMVKVGSGLAIFVFIFMIIQSLFSTASTKIEDFNNSRTLISELNSLKSKLSSSPVISTPPSRGELVQRVRASIQGTNITSSQIDSIRSTNVKGDIKKTSLNTGGVEVRLKTLNLSQITDVASRIQRISQSLKITSVDITESTEEPKYFDVNYKIATFYPKIAKVEPEEDEDKGKENKRRKRRIRKPPKDDEEKDEEEKDE